MDSHGQSMVESRLEDAAHVIRRLPAVRMPAYFNTWPTMLIEFADRVGGYPNVCACPLPLRVQSRRMEEALEWLRWLDGDDAKLVWAGCEGMPWKQICCRLGLHAQRRIDAGSTLCANRMATEWPQLPTRTVSVQHAIEARTAGPE